MDEQEPPPESRWKSVFLASLAINIVLLLLLGLSVGAAFVFSSPQKPKHERYEYREVMFNNAKYTTRRDATTGEIQWFRPSTGWEKIGKPDADAFDSFVGAKVKVLPPTPINWEEVHPRDLPPGYKLDPPNFIPDKR